MVENKNNRWKIFTDQLKNKYRLVILNDNTFAEKLAFRLSPLGLIIAISAVTIVMTTLVISLIAFYIFSRAQCFWNNKKVEAKGFKQYISFF